jgi:hypothetical protein
MLPPPTEQFDPLTRSVGPTAFMSYPSFSAVVVVIASLLEIAG